MNARMPAPYIISYGETMLRFSPAPGTRLEDASTYTAYVAGSESNTLAVVSRLGMQAVWLSALPSNPLGRHLEAELRRHGVDTSRVVWADASERVGLFYAEESAAPLGTQVVYDRADSACARLDFSALNLSGLEDAGLLHLTGITPALGNRARSTFAGLLHFASQAGMPLSFDVNYRGKLWSPAQAEEGMEAACRQTSVLFCTQADAAAIWGFSGTAEEVLRRMASRFGEAGKTLVLTLGSKGSAQLSSGAYSSAAAFISGGSYRFGSGDAFAGGYLYAHLGGEIYRAFSESHAVTPLMFGNALAALKRCIAGDIAIVNPSDVAALLATHRDGGAAYFR